MTEKQIIIDGLCIRYYENKGPHEAGTLVFLHGWGSEASHLKNIWEKCNDFLALDLPGFGRSERPKDIWAIGDYASFLRKFLEKTGINEPILVGHSFGGSIITQYLAGGNRAKKAILISPSGVREKKASILLWKIAAKVFKGLLSFPGINKFKDRFRKEFYRAIDSEDYIQAGELTESYKMIIREDLRPEMGKIRVPVVLIWGEKDKATPLRYGEIMKQLIKNSQLVVIKEAGHFSFIDRPAEFNNIFSKEIDAH